jgi:predicted transcriptional regulator
MRRDKLDVLRDILAICSGGKVIKTHIIYRSNTNFLIATNYINWLLSHELLAKNGQFYGITPKGLDLLANLNKITSA